MRGGGGLEGEALGIDGAGKHCNFLMLHIHALHLNETS
jgi:hypothetical protein